MKAFFLLIPILMSGTASAKDYIATGNAWFHADASVIGMSVDGTGGKVTGTASDNEGLITGEFSVKVQDFVTGIGLRDDHMKNKYMEMDKFPEIILKIKDYKLGAPEFTGNLTLHGVTKPVTGKIVFVGQTIKAQFLFKVTDFGIASPNWKGVGTDETFTAFVEINYK